MNKLIKLSLLLLIGAVSSFSAVSQDVTQPHPGKKDVAVTGTLPVMYIVTADSVPITQKEDYVDATYWIDSKGIDGFSSTGSADSQLALQIRGRGNSSWTYDKKPYKLKLGKKAELLGMPKHKHWALLNHAPSQCGFLEMVGFEITRRCGLDWTPRHQPVEVILNDRNIGLYYLTEGIKIDENRINIYEQPDLNTDPTTVDGGWLLEIDNYDDPYQVKIFQGADSTGFEARFTHKVPEELSDLQHDWLVSELTTLTGLIYDSDKSVMKWADKIDVPTLARYYIAQEYIGNLDAFFGSTYLYRDLGEGKKWMFGPMWDCSWSYFENPYRTGTFNEQRQADCKLDPNCTEIKFTWIEEMWKFPDFRIAVKNEWDKLYPDAFASMPEFISETHDRLKAAYDLNYGKIWPEPGAYDLTYLRNAYIQNIALHGQWLDTYLNTAAISDVTADGPDCSLTLDIRNLGSGTIKVTSPQAEITRVELITLNGQVVPAQSLGANLFNTSLANGLFVVKAYTSAGKYAVAKLSLNN